jgi:Protein of unknown function (DUF1236)
LRLPVFTSPTPWALEQNCLFNTYAVSNGRKGDMLYLRDTPRRHPMRNALLTTVAAIGLFAGANLAAAQTPAEPRKEQPSVSQQEQKAPRAAAEEKSQDKSKAAQEKGKPASEKAAQEQAKPTDNKGKAADGKADEKAKPTAEKAAQEQAKPTDNKGKAGEKAAEDKAAETKSKAAEGKAADEKAKPASEKAAQDQAKPSDNKGKAVEEKGKPASDKAAQDQAKPSEKAAQGKENVPEKAAADAKTGSTVAPEKQAKISEVLTKEKVEPVTNVNFSISIGTSVPETVRARRLPDEIVVIVPEYRGYDYFVVEEEIVIIEPRTRKIVVTIPRHGSRSASVSTTSSRINLAADKRRQIYEIVMRERIQPVETQIEITVGTELPRAVAVHKFSDKVYSEFPELRSYEYFVRSDDVVLVRERKIVEVIN